MLVLSRKPGEKIMVGEDITIVIVRIGPNAVRVGIEAPHGLNIVRAEIIETKPTSAQHEMAIEDLGSATQVERCE